MGKRRNLDLYGPFVLHSLEMRESPAWRALSDKGRRILDRLEVEHMAHGGAENGNLICTYDDFENAGIRRKSVSRAIRECVTLGFLEITVCGGLTRIDIRRPSRYRLTYLIGRSKSPDPTHDWKHIKAAKEAKPERGQIFSPGAKTPLHAVGAKTPLHSGGENATPGPGAKTLLLSTYREGGKSSKGEMGSAPPPPGISRSSSKSATESERTNEMTRPAGKDHERSAQPQA